MDEKTLLEKGYKKYYGDEVDVFFNGELCKGAGVCHNGNPEVFNVGRTPWLLPLPGQTENIIEIIDKCPSGALQYLRK